jgi:hypothetical protein
MNYKKLILTIFLLSAFSGVLSQQKTTYQIKIFEIKKKYAKKILIAQGEWNQQTETELYYSNEAKLNTILRFGLISTPNLIKSIEDEFKQAEKLKNSIDFKREKEENIRKKNTEIENSKRKKEELIREKNARIKEKARAKLEQYEKTDIGDINKKIKLKLQKWNLKGEFEKEASYLERLKNQSKKAFIEICTKIIKDKVNYYGRYGIISSNLLTYNSEEEFFPIIFSYENIESKEKLNISIEKASEFKSKSTGRDRTYVYVDDYDWIAIENTFFPTKVTFVNKYMTPSKYEIPITLNQGKNILCYFDELGIDNEYLKGIVFEYSKSSKLYEATTPVKKITNKTIKRDELKNKKIEKQGSIYYTINVDNLRVRTSPLLNSEKIENLSTGSDVEFIEKSTNQTTVNIRNKEITEYWYKVKTPSGNIGWIHGCCFDK